MLMWLASFESGPVARKLNVGRKMLIDLFCENYDKGVFNEISTMFLRLLPAVYGLNTLYKT